MERERIEMLIKHHELIRDRYAGSNFACTQQEAIEVLRLALLAIDSERARRVGEAVLDAISGIDRLSVIKSMSKCADALDSWGNHTTSRVLRSVVASLRGEP